MRCGGCNLVWCGGGVGWLQWWCLGSAMVLGGGEVRWSWRFGGEVVMEVCLGEEGEEG